MAQGKQKHPYHMVEPSPWPVLGALGTLLLAIGGIIYMGTRTGPEDFPWETLPGFAIILYTMYVWWRDVLREGSRDKAHTDEVAWGLKFGFVLFIASEVMFFVAWFWAFFNASVPFFSKTALETFPPPGVEPIHWWWIPALNTAILLSSGGTVTAAHHAVREGHNRKAAWWILATVLLGFIFLGIQIYEYGHAAFSYAFEAGNPAAGGIFPSTFFMATGFHGFHVFVGACFLLVMLIRAWKNDFTPERHIGFEAAAWYWHFVDVVWLFLFLWVYIWVTA